MKVVVRVAVDSPDGVGGHQTRLAGPGWTQDPPPSVDAVGSGQTEGDDLSGRQIVDHFFCVSPFPVKPGGFGAGNIHPLFFDHEETFVGDSLEDGCGVVDRVRLNQGQGPL